MLATLNLQLSPVDFSDDTLANSMKLLPDAGAEAESGFAHLLRLRVDTTSQLAPESGQFTLQEGEVLPPGGNPLPPAQSLPALIGTEPLPPNAIVEIDAGEERQRPIELPVLPDAVVSQGVEGQLSPPQLTPQPAPQPVPTAERDGATDLSGEELPGEITDISLDSSVYYPPQREVPAVATGSATLSPPAVTAVQIQPPVVEAPANTIDESIGLRSRPQPPAVPQLTRPELAARTQDFFAAAREPVEIPVAGTGLRERGQRLMPETKPLPVSPAPLPFEAVEETARAELPKRLDLVAPPRTDSVRDAVTEVVQTRAAVPQPAQTPPVQPVTQSAQPSQPIIALAPATAATADASYPAAAQQSTDLIGTPVREASWGQQISERVVLMAGKNINAAEIRLTPAELGPLRVRVSVEDGAANVMFHAHHAVTREAIEQAMPRLRELLTENGLTLGQADVAEQDVAERDRNNEADGRLSQEAPDGTLDSTEDSSNGDEVSLAPNSGKQNGLIDTFA